MLSLHFADRILVVLGEVREMLNDLPTNHAVWLLRHGAVGMRVEDPRFQQPRTALRQGQVIGGKWLQLVSPQLIPTFRTVAYLDLAQAPLNNLDVVYDVFVLA